MNYEFKTPDTYGERNLHNSQTDKKSETLEQRSVLSAWEI